MLTFGHVAISVSDIERTAVFYETHFGFRCLKRYSLDSGKLKICIIKKEDAVLELFCFQDAQPLPAYRQDLDSDLRTHGVKHFSLEVDDIEQVYRDVKASSVPLATEIRTFSSGARYFFIKDPDGILIEIMEARDE